MNKSTKIFILLQVFFCLTVFATSPDFQKFLQSTKDLFSNSSEQQKFASMLMISTQEESDDPFTEIMKSTGFFCSSCQSFFQKIQDTDFTKSEKNIATIIEFGCAILRIDEPAVCKGAVNEMAPTVFENFVKRYLDPHYVCPHLKICPQYYETVDIKNLADSIIKDKPQNTRPIPTQEKTFKVLHMTDLHYDEFYIENSNAKCKEPDCCRETSGKPKDDKSKAGYWGTIGNCDIPFRTIEATVSYIKINLANDLDFIVWTGDNTSHYIWDQSYESNTQQTLKIIELLKKELPNIPVFPITGNHESFPVNVYDYFGDHEKIQNEQFANNWESWIGKEAADMYRNNGYYSTILTKYGQTLRIIGFNTQSGNNENWYLIRNPTDPKNELQWLGKQLKQAEQNNEKVYIIGHIPSNDQLLEWSQIYNALIERYSHIITSQFYGHTHDDQIQVFRDSDSNKINNIAFIAPSVTSFGGQNPSFRIYKVDYDTLLPVNYDQYRLNLTLYNTNNVRDITQVNFDLAYDFNSYYGYTDMSNLQSIEDLLQRLQTDLKTFQLYKFAYNAGVDTSQAQVIEKSYFCNTYSTPELSQICNTQKYKKDIISQIFGGWFVKLGDKLTFE